MNDSLNLADIYPYPAIRGTRITRLEERTVGQFRLDAEAAARLSVDNVGIFVGGCGQVSQIFTYLERICEAPYPSRWLVIASSKDLNGWLFSHFEIPQRTCARKHVPDVWEAGSAVFATPETLPRLLVRYGTETPYAGILVVDPLCHIHKARGTWRCHNDRPQLIADFRAALATFSVAPPLLLFTSSPAKSINTSPMLSPYCLDAWWFLDGARLRVGRPPAASHEGSHGINPWSQACESPAF